MVNLFVTGAALGLGYIALRNGNVPAGSNVTDQPPQGDLGFAGYAPTAPVSQPSISRPSGPGRINPDSIVVDQGFAGYTPVPVDQGFAGYAGKRVVDLVPGQITATPVIPFMATRAAETPVTDSDLPAPVGISTPSSNQSPPLPGEAAIVEPANALGTQTVVGNDGHGVVIAPLPSGTSSDTPIEAAPRQVSAIGGKPAPIVTRPQSLVAAMLNTDRGLTPQDNARAFMEYGAQVGMVW